MTAPSGDRPQVEVCDNPEAGRYELRHDGEVVGVARYRLGDGGVMVVSHVEVVPELRGGGHSGPFFDRVLADVEHRGLKVVPTCGWAAGHVHSRPDLSHLLA